jgi:hypothetical protein
MEGEPESAPQAGHEIVADQDVLSVAFQRDAERLGSSIAVMIALGVLFVRIIRAASLVWAAHAARDRQLASQADSRASSMRLSADQTSVHANGDDCG